MKIWISRADAERAGDCSQSIKLDYLGGLWAIMTRPMMDPLGRRSAVHVEPADELARFLSARISDRS
jgi:hypothetical protein